MKEIRHRIMALLLAVLFVSYYAGSTMCEHVHYVDDVMVVHSHPFGGSSHSHSATGMQTLSVLNGMLVFVLAAVSTVIVTPLVVMEIVPAVTATHILSYRSSVALRAPPVID